MRKNIVLFLIGIILCVFLTSCGVPTPPTEKQIARELPDDITTIIIENPFDYTNANVYEMDVEDVTIEKRQTNEKTDVVYCIVELSNKYYHFTKYMKLEYYFYDQGGWLLDNYGEYEDAEWELLEVPFNVEEASAALYNYEISGPGTVTSDLLNNVIWFSFPIEEVHANGAYEGTGLVTCQFDGKRWQSETNTDNIHFVWDIQGTWVYSYIKETSYDKTINKIEVDITDFDQTTGSMSGSWYMHSYFSFLRIDNETKISLYNNPERVEVNIATDRTLVELWERPNDAGLHSFVRFYPDKVEAAYSTLSGAQFGTVHLERQSSGTTHEEFAYASGICGENVTWTLDRDGLLTISGKGPMEYDTYGADFYDNITKVVIEDGVTSVLEHAFGSYSLTSVTIPDSVTSIGDSAFYNCYNLTSVTIPNSVTSIGDDAFGACFGLTSINVASGNPVYSSVDGVLFNANRTLLHTYPAGKSGSSYNIPASVTGIGDSAFWYSGLTSVTIPNSVTSIGDDAFSSCGSLASVTIPDSVTSIGDDAFFYCHSLTSVTIPDSVTSIGASAFSMCFSLADVYYSGSEAQWNQIAIEGNNDDLFNATIHYNS